MRGIASQLSRSRTGAESWPPDSGGYREERRGERKEGRRDRMVRLGDQQRMLQTPDEPIQMETGLRLEAAAQCTAGQREAWQGQPAKGYRRLVLEEPLARLCFRVL